MNNYRRHSRFFVFNSIIKVMDMENISMHLVNILMSRKILIKLVVFFFAGCYSKPNKTPVFEYAADVEYYNPRTGTDHTYEITVIVKEGKVISLEWPNGGNLDDSHFSPPNLDDEGVATFTSDKGYEYTITITDDDYFEPEYPDYEPEY